VPQLLRQVRFTLSRSALFYKLQLVGEYPNEKIGFGNLSCRLPDKKSFLITGGQTGHLPHLQPHHYTRVTHCDLSKGHVIAEGLIAPSIESLIHYELYESDSSIQYIFHLHHHRLWEYLQTSGHEVAQGIIKNQSNGIFVMKGHQDEIIAFAPSAEEAGKLVLDLYRKIVSGESEG
jgi:ribulose-5-phosphate 4-epimerase/fuculose-1-phosphate aldolase